MNKFLNRVYSNMKPEETRQFYDEWASSYDSEIAENGYVTPKRVASALYEHIADCNTPILDFGCGTGISGQALKLAGFSVIDGMDPSREMLEVARQKGIYRKATVSDIDDSSPIPNSVYKAIAAIGVIGIGSAPFGIFHVIMNALQAGGLMGFSLNDHALADAEYEGALHQWIDNGKARLLFREYGPHLPGQNIKSNVYVVEKL